jgi:hypothetical protein
MEIRGCIYSPATRKLLGRRGGGTKSPSGHFRVESHTLALNPLNAELKPICHLLALLERAAIVDVSGLRVNRAETKLQRFH